MHFHAIPRVLFCSVLFHSVNLLPVRPAFWAAFGGEEKCTLGKSTHVHHVKLHVQEKCSMKMSTHKKVHNENLAFLRHRRQFFPLPSFYLDV